LYPVAVLFTTVKKALKKGVETGIMVMAGAYVLAYVGVEWSFVVCS
jgi:threonine/homoserine/homoserine lactone efflux protein